MTHTVRVGDKYRVKPGTVFHNPFWYHLNHYTQSIFTVTVVDEDRIFSTCNLCGENNEVPISEFIKYCFVTNSVIIIKNTPTKLDI